jgi:class I fructose-bisphosphate aldolase
MNQEYRVVNKFLKDGHGLLFAYDHGFEYGPGHFDERSVEPTYALELAESGGFTGFICQKGIAAHYYDPYIHKIPLIVKLNGKTSFRTGHEPKSIQNCSVDEAISYGAAGVGYVIHVGSLYEAEMIAEFGRVEREAHEKGLAVFVWMYITGDDILQPEHSDTVAYAARVGMELNADGIIVKYTGDEGSFRWVVKNAGHAKVFVVGGPRMDTPYQLTETAKVIVRTGAAGFAIGRNVWQSKDPILVVHQISTELFGEGHVTE